MSPEERAIDEAIAETFPASDTPTPVMPGSLAGVHYAAQRDAAFYRHIATTLAALGAIAFIAVLARRLRG
jgi:hypothetical protein